MTERKGFLTHATGSVDHDHRASAPWRRRVLAIGVLGVFRWLVVAVFIVSGALKLLDLPGFRRSLWTMGFFPDYAIRPLAWLVPSLEVGAAIGLAFPRVQFVGASVAMFLSAAFVGLHAYLYAKGIVVPCGCIGIREGAPGRTDHLVMAIVCAAMFLAAAAVGASPRRRRPSVQPAPEPRR